MFKSCLSNYKVKDPNIDIKKLQPVLDQYMDVPGSLITILQKAQELYGYLPVDLLTYIALYTGNKPAKVMGVVTFYTQFRLNPVGKYLILLCQGTACHVNSAADIEVALINELGVKEGEITQDGLFTFENVACLGCCSLSPVMMINDETFGNLTPAKVKSLIQEFRDREQSAIIEKNDNKEIVNEAILNDQIANDKIAIAEEINLTEGGIEA